MANNNLEVTKIRNLKRTATSDNLTDEEYLAVDKTGGYTRKMTVANLAAWVLGKIKSLTTITAFRTGDMIPVDGSNGLAKMSKDDLLKEARDAGFTNWSYISLSKAYKYDGTEVTIPASITHSSDAIVANFSIGDCVKSRLTMNVTTTATKVVVMLYRVNIVSGNVPAPGYEYVAYNSNTSGTFEFDIDIDDLCRKNPNFLNNIGSTYLRIYVDGIGNGTTTINSIRVSKDIADYYDSFEDTVYSVDRYVSSSGRTQVVGALYETTVATNAIKIYLGHETSGHVKLHIQSTQRVGVIYLAKNWINNKYHSNTSIYQSGISNQDFVLDIDLSEYAQNLVHPYMGAEIVVQTTSAWGPCNVKLLELSFTSKRLAENCKLWAAGQGRTYVVRKEGGENSDYTSFSECLIALACEFFPTIIVRGGVYDIADEMSEYLDTTGSTSWWRYGLSIPGGAKILCSSSAKFTCEYTGANSLTRSSFSILNHDAQPFGFEINGMVASTKNVRYTIHDDYHSFVNPTIAKFINCELKNDCSQNSDWVHALCIGGGFGTNSSVIIDSCVFESVYYQGSTETLAASYHNSEQAGRSICVIKNCYVKGAYCVGITNLGASTEKSLLICNGNSFGVALDYPSASDNVEYIAWGNEVRT